MDLKDLKHYLNTKRRDFSNQAFSEEISKDNPFSQYANWFKEAVESEVLDPYAACLSTVDQFDKPSSRMVYIRDIIDDGFVFYTNYNSSKGEDLSNNNAAAFNIFWGELERQIRIQGFISKVDEDVSNKYFNARPRASKIGAWASSQSETLKNRKELEDRVLFFKEKFKDDEVLRPPHWGGYSLVPDKIEFWQGRSSRLHDRILYTKENDLWTKRRLSP